MRLIFATFGGIVSFLKKKPHQILIKTRQNAMMFA